MKLCKDCKFYNDWSIYECRHPETTIINPVTGEQLYTGAVENRKRTDLCGMTARWFEPKKSFFDRFRKQKIDLS